MHFELETAVLNYEKFESKVVIGGKAFERNQNFDKKIGAHWRYWYECYKSDCLKEEHEKIIGVNYIDEFLDKKVLINDKSVYDFFINFEGNHEKYAP